MITRTIIAKAANPARKTSFWVTVLGFVVVVGLGSIGVAFKVGEGFKVA